MIKRKILVSSALVFIFMTSGISTASRDHNGAGHKQVIEQMISLKKDGSIMSYVPGGMFIMGNSTGDNDEKPEHRVTLKPFYMDQFEITNIQYRKFVEETKYKEPIYWNDANFNGALQPVVGVSWEDARTYAAWAGKRLPTEAEWEMAARSTDGREYPWGNTWRDNLCNSEESGKSRVVQVGSYPDGISPYGIHDMAGNVWEWCEDSYSSNYYKNSPQNNPTGAKVKNDKILRGGSWGYDKVNLRASNRFWDDKDILSRHVGFRCVRDLE